MELRERQILLPNRAVLFVSGANDRICGGDPDFSHETSHQAPDVGGEVRGAEQGVRGCGLDPARQSQHFWRVAWWRQRMSSKKMQ